MQLATADTAPAAGTDPQLGAPAPPALAAWLVPGALAADALAIELVSRLTKHYSNRGDLVLLATGLGAEALAETRRLGRRAETERPATTPGSTNVARLPGTDSARLALATATSPREAAALAARFAPKLRTGGFLALACTPARPAGPLALGAIVRGCQQEAPLRYWQHIVVIDPAARTTGGRGRRAVRLHYDLLILRASALTQSESAAAEIRAAA
jgi:hypothetical protein